MNQDAQAIQIVAQTVKSVVGLRLLYEASPATDPRYVRLQLWTPDRKTSLVNYLDTQQTPFEFQREIQQCANQALSNLLPPSR